MNAKDLFLYKFFVDLIKFCFIVFIVFLFTQNILAEERSSLEQPMNNSMNDNYFVYTLNNGLKVFIKEVKAFPVVSVQYWIHVGSKNEQKGQEGFAHLVEHMLFKGTKKYPVGAIDKEIKKLGASQNAFTSFDYTCYHITGNKEYFERFFELMSEAVFNSTFDENEFNKEVQVVLEELRMDNDDPKSYLYNMIRNTAYLVHPYKHPIIGYYNTIASAKREDVYNFYRKYYVPSNMWLVVVGDVIASDAIRVIKNITNNLEIASSSNTPIIHDVPSEPKQAEIRIKREYGNLNQAYLGLSWHAPSIKSKDNVILDVISALLTKGKSSFLIRSLIYDEKIATNIESSYYTTEDPSLFIIFAELPQANVNVFIDKSLNIIRNLTKCLSYDDLEKAKNQVVSNFIFSLEKVEDQAFTYGHYAILGKLDEADKYISLVKQIKLEDINRIINEIFVDTNLTVCRYEPEISSTTLKPEMLILHNGLKLILKSNNNLPVVSVVVNVDAGGIKESKGEAGLSYLTAKCLLNGTTLRSSQEIHSMLDSYGTKLEIIPQKSFVTIKMQCLANKFYESLDLLLEMITKPSFTQTEFEKEKMLALEKIKQDEDDLFKSTLNEALKHLFKNTNIAYPVYGKEDDLKTLKNTDCIEFHRKFYTANNMVFAIVGDIFANDDKPKIVSKLSNIPTGKVHISKHTKEIELKAPQEVTIKKNKLQSQIIVVNKTFKKSHQLKPAMDILQSILSGSMYSRLFTNLRDIKSLAYAVWCQNVSMIHDGYFYATLSTAVDKSLEAKDALIKELELIKSNGFTDEEFEDAKKYLLGQYALSLEDNTSLAITMANDEYFGLGYDYYQKYPQIIKHTTKDEVVEASKWILKDNSYVLVVSKP